jgi:hypothetical protein
MPEILGETAHTDAIHDSGIKAGIAVRSRGMTIVARSWGRLHPRWQNQVEESCCVAGVASTDHLHCIDEQDTSMRIAIGIMNKQYRERCVAVCSTTLRWK